MKAAQIKFRVWTGCRNIAADRTSDRCHEESSTETQWRGRDAKRSRSGCAECKRRHLKCDEAFPVCLRCQKRGSLCQSTLPLTKWQHEAPWIRLGRGFSSSALPGPTLPVATANDDRTLLCYWLEQASQIMVIDPEDNPLSFPILEHAEQCPSLKYAVQSVAAGHRSFFNPHQLSKCLEERSSALRLVIREVSRPSDSLIPIFMSVFVLGLSEAWINPPTGEFGQRHLRGARALVDMFLDDPVMRETQRDAFNLVIGSYIYWDMATSFLIPFEEQSRINTPEMYSAILDIGREYHPIGGYSTEIFYLVANVGRYCRTMLDTGIRDDALEAVLEQEMEAWEPEGGSEQLILMSDSYRLHGLISLAAICFRRGRHEPDPTVALSGDSTTRLADSDDLSRELGIPFAQQDLEATIRGRALTIVRNLISIPPSQACTVLQAIPLFTAASELTQYDDVERRLVEQRFKEIYSLNRLRVNLSAMQILEEMWGRRDAGETVNWLECMIEKGWNIMLG